MKNIQATGYLFGTVTTLVQINKTVAKRLFNEGKMIYLQSCNMQPFNPWQSVCPIQSGKNVSLETFEDNVNSYSYYNLDSQRGNYIHYYCDYSNAPKR